MTIGILNYGMGNLSSIKNALDFLGEKNKIVDDYKDIKKFDGLILPGVGAYPEAVKNLKKKNFISELDEFVFNKKKNILGICLGMQLILSTSTEKTFTDGLNYIKGDVKFLNFKNISVPHVGWSQINILKRNSLLKKIDKESYFYFDHSYYFYDNLKKNIDAELNYGRKISAIISKDNIFGVQFHPEKSQTSGLTLLNNFVEL